MNMKKTTLFFFSCLAALSLQAQEISFGLGGISNPVINPDHSVTFTFSAPDLDRLREDGFPVPDECGFPQAT